MTEQITNMAESQLAAGISSSDVTLSVVSAAGFPTSGDFRVVLEDEIMIVTGVAGTTFTVTREAEGTTAVGHLVGVPVKHVLTVESLEAIIHQVGQVPNGVSVIDPAIAVATADNVGSGAAANAIDGNGSTYWGTSGGSAVAGHWLHVDLGAPYPICAWALAQGIPSAPDFSSRSAWTYEIESSTDDSTWTVRVASHDWGSQGSETVFLPAMVTARYWRMTALTGGADYWKVYIFDLLQWGYQLRLEKGATLGYAPLDAAGKVPTGFLPASLTNPMTTLGDLIVGDTGGAPIALPVGSESDVVTVVGGIPAWAPAGGGGGITLPRVKQMTFGGTAISSITLDAAPDSGDSILLYCDGYNSGDPSVVSSTNTTWAKVMSVSAGAKYSLWVGTVSGGSGGTVITITHPNSYMSALAVVIADTLSRTLGNNSSASVSAVAGIAATTAGHLVVCFGGADNTIANVQLSMSVPAVGLAVGVVIGLVGYAVGDRVYGVMSQNPGTLMLCELT